MFPHADPAGGDLLERFGAIGRWREMVDRQMVLGAREPSSAFTLLEALAEIEDETDPAAVDWIAFPKKRSELSDEEIDGRRGLQDEYVEWSILGASDPPVLVFTTELREYFAALAGVGFDAIRAAICELDPGAEPTEPEIYGPGFTADSASPFAREAAFLRSLGDNPWNDGRRGILALTNGPNSLSALFALVKDCGVIQPDAAPIQVCSLVNCDSARNSDPFICAAVQNLARADRALAPADPVGIAIKNLAGIWKLGSREIDISDGEENEGVWTVGRNGRRGVLVLRDDLTIDGEAIRSGAQVARLLRVETTVLTAPNAALPAGARTGHESTRLIS